MKQPKKAAWKVWLRRFFLTGLTLALLAGGFVAWTNYAAYAAGSGRLYDHAEDVPAGRVGVVFGCPERFQGRENLYFRYRMDAAAELWKAGKLRYLIVSGDNRDRYYNEPEKMRNALVKRGVPADKIRCDYAGLRTLDSVLRVAEIFEAKDIVFISQQFQNERAAYIAQAHGISFCGYNAQDVNRNGGLRVKGREVLARVKMWLDVKVWKTRPIYEKGTGDLAS